MNTAQHMRQGLREIDHTQFRNFSPINRLTETDTEELLRGSITIQLAPGSPIFGMDNKKNRILYLLSGKITLLTNRNKRLQIDAGTHAAKHPLGGNQPGQIAATALTEITLLSLSADMLELFLSWATPNSYQVNELPAQDPLKMSRLLQFQGIRSFSDSALQNLIARMQETFLKAGDVVIQQDGADDNYYIIKQGRCGVSRKPDNNTKTVKLAELKEGDAFGEEALLTESPRNATITMLEDGALMRLSKENFSTLLANPLLNTILWQKAQKKLALNAVLLDVRTVEEHAEQHLPNSVNIPLSLFRLKLKQLDRQRKYIVYSNDSGRSSVATFLLRQRGYDAHILEGGIYAPLLEDIVEKQKSLKEEELGYSTYEEITTPSHTEQLSSEVNRTAVDNKKESTDKEKKSLADHWGDVVDDAPDDIFVQTQATWDPLGKTEAVDSKVKAPLKSIIDKNRVAERTTFSENSRATIRQKKRRNFSTRIFSLVLLLGLAAAVTLIPMQTVHPPEAVTPPILNPKVVIKESTTNIAPPPEQQKRAVEEVIISPATQFIPSPPAEQTIESSPALIEQIPVETAITVEAEAALIPEFEEAPITADTPAAELIIDPATRELVQPEENLNKPEENDYLPAHTSLPTLEQVEK